MSPLMRLPPTTPSPPGDKNTIPERSVVKVDMGAHVDGYVTDTAFTVSFDPQYDVMVGVAQIALQTAIDTVRADVSPGKIGGAIETAITNRGFRPIQNLTGHSVGRYLIHAGTSIPNVHQMSLGKLKAGELYAIERSLPCGMLLAPLKIHLKKQFFA